MFIRKNMWAQYHALFACLHHPRRAWLPARHTIHWRSISTYYASCVYGYDRLPLPTMWFEIMCSLSRQIDQFCFARRQITLFSSFLSFFTGKRGGPGAYPDTQVDGKPVLCKQTHTKAAAQWKWCVCQGRHRSMWGAAAAAAMKKDEEKEMTMEKITAALKKTDEGSLGEM